MRKESKRVISIILTLVLLCLAGCTSNEKTVIDNIEAPKLEKASLTIYFEGAEPVGMKEVLAEVEKRSAAELNINLSFQYLYMFTEAYYKELQRIITSGENCDAFMVMNDSRQSIESFVENGIAADITDLLPKYAPQLYSQIDNGAKDYVRVKDRLYAVPRVFPISQRLGVTVRNDLLQKYNITSISNYDELEAFLAIIKKNEPDLFALTTSFTSLGLFAQVYGYAILDYQAGLVYKWDDKDMTIMAWEQTPEYLEAENRLASWFKNGYIAPGHIIQTDTIMYKSGKWATIINGMGNTVYSNLRNLHDDESTNYTFTEFPLYPEAIAPKGPPILYSFVISQQSENKERVLMLLDWIHSSRDNYRLLRYGLEERDYTIVNGAISFPETIGSLDDLFVNWFGGSSFMDMNLEGPYWMGDKSLDFTAYWEEICKNTEYPHHAGFVPDYTPVYNCYMTRSSTFTDTVQRMNRSQYIPADSEEYIERMKKAGTDELVKTIQNQLDLWRESSGK